jgi:toxin FitB
MRLMLDTNVLGCICHPRKHRDVQAWFRSILVRRPRLHDVAIPEIADYELRRKLLHLRAAASLGALDALASRIAYVPLDTATMRLSAELWARLRAAGTPTAGDGALDADVILAAQAILRGATVVTTNVRHLGRLVPAMAWPEVPAA